MARLSDLQESEATFLRGMAENMQRIEPGNWVQPPALTDATVALVSTAGLHQRHDLPFTLGSLDYRVIGADSAWGDLVQSHVSANFDRSAYQSDPNITLPLDRLREMAEAGEIGGVSERHYSFMGAMPMVELFEETGTEVGNMLAADGVDVALLIPV
jgi:D-proline reductase (dithiol) PrdB